VEEGLVNLSRVMMYLDTEQMCVGVAYIFLLHSSGAAIMSPTNTGEMLGYEANYKLH